jgi:hypothetical protein
MVEEVAVFYSPAYEKWIIRCFGFGQLGDCVANTEPTDDELKRFFGEIKIKRGYELISSRATKVIGEAMEKNSPDPDKIIFGFFKALNNNE